MVAPGEGPILLALLHKVGEEFIRIVGENGHRKVACYDTDVGILRTNRAVEEVHCLFVVCHKAELDLWVGNLHNTQIFTLGIDGE